MPASDHEPLFLGLDVGTQSVRAGLFDPKGERRGFASAPIDTAFPQPGWAEQNPLQWWEAARQAVPAAIQQSGARADRVAALGLDCTACTVVAALQDGTVLHPALLWMDQRAHREAAEIGATRDASLRWVSGAVSPEWLLPKALWLKRHQQAAYERAERLVEGTDWLMYRLTGDWSLSLNHVTVKWNYARPDGGWSKALLERADLADLPRKWPASIVPLGGGNGKLAGPAATELGLPAGLPVAQGGIDAYLGMIGLGAVGPGAMALIMGSSTCHLAVADVPLLGTGMLGCFPDAIVPGQFVLEGGQTSTGSILNWYRQHFAGNEAIEASRSNRSVYEVLDARAASVPPGSDGLVCLDYWQGNRCPRKDPLARGALWGFTLAHGPGHVFRSIYEGTALGTRHILDDLASHGFKVGKLSAGGGGAQSRLWVQIHADACQMPVQVPRETESCVLGSAMIAAVHSGHYGSLEEAASHMVQMDRTVAPDPRLRAVYDDTYRRYLATYDGLRGLMGS